MSVMKMNSSLVVFHQISKIHLVSKEFHLNYQMNVDNFQYLFDSINLKIASMILFLICITFFNAFSILCIMFEKYASDWMKRSINNQLVSQLMLAMLLNNNLITPCFTWRVMIGPIYPPIATFASFLGNVCVSWYLLTLTQMTLVKILLIFKWSFMAGIDDNFMGKYLQLVNLGFLFVSQFYRYILGSMYESQEFQILSGQCISTIDT